MDKDIVFETNAANYENLKRAIQARNLIYVYGPSSSGKTFLVKKALEVNRMSILYAFIDCNQLTTPSKLYLQILFSLREKLKIPYLRSRFQKSATPRMLPFLDFQDLYEDIIKTGQKKGFDHIYIVLDRIDLFRKPMLNDVFVQLVHTIDMNIICISISSVSTITYNANYHSKLSLIQLDPFNKSDMADAICMDEPRVEPELYKIFVNNVVSTIYGKYTKDYSEIKSFCREYYPKFYDKFEPLKKEQRKTNSSGKIIGHLLDSIEELIEEKYRLVKTLEQVDRKVTLSTSMMIIAAFVAAYTKTSDDKKNWVKMSQKRAERPSDDSKSKSKPFTLERLLHIYAGIVRTLDGVQDCEDIPDSALGAVTLLEEIRLLEGTDQTSYRISPQLRLEYVNRIASQISFPLDTIHGL